MTGQRIRILLGAANGIRLPLDDGCALSIEAYKGDLDLRQGRVAHIFLDLAVNGTPPDAQPTPLLSSAPA